MNIEPTAGEVAQRGAIEPANVTRWPRWAIVARRIIPLFAHQRVSSPRVLCIVRVVVARGCISFLCVSPDRGGRMGSTVTSVTESSPPLERFRRCLRSGVDLLRSAVRCGGRQITVSTTPIQIMLVIRIRFDSRVSGTPTWDGSSRIPVRTQT